MRPPARLSIAAKVAYSTGDLTVNLVLSAASFFYLFFLVEFAGLRPALAGLVPLVARTVDALSDPAMGRISDLTRWRGERRRPFFLLGAVPLGLGFALMWSDCPWQGEWARAAWYTGVYSATSLAMTVVSVPYLALIPEMATGYDERTSLNTFRAAAAVLGTLAAVAMKPLADALGGSAQAWWQAGAIAGVGLVLPWLLVHRVSFERPEFARESRIGLIEGARIALRHRAYRILVGFYIASRISMDLIGALFLLYFTYWIRREGDFQLTLGLFLGVSVLSLPFWLRLARRFDKRSIFLVGSTWWIVSQLVIYAVSPEWPRWSVFLAAALAAVGYAVADLMPWAMLGDVIDEDELATGERREGIYVGLFMFLRKLGGAVGVAVVGFALDLSGYVGGVPPEQQTDLAIQSIRALTAFGPAVFLAIAIWLAVGYPLSRAKHGEILERIRRRD